MSNPVGHPTEPIRKAWAMRFGIDDRHHKCTDLTDQMMNQLSRCKSDEARRIILGISEKYTNDGPTDALTVRYSGEHEEYDRLPPE